MPKELIYYLFPHETYIHAPEIDTDGEEEPEIGTGEVEEEEFSPLSDTFSSPTTEDLARRSDAKSEFLHGAADTGLNAFADFFIALIEDPEIQRIFRDKDIHHIGDLAAPHIQELNRLCDNYLENEEDFFPRAEQSPNMVMLSTMISALKSTATTEPTAAQILQVISIIWKTCCKKALLLQDNNFLKKIFTTTILYQEPFYFLQFCLQQALEDESLVKVVNLLTIAHSVRKLNISPPDTIKKHYNRVINKAYTAIEQQDEFFFEARKIVGPKDEKIPSPTIAPEVAELKNAEQQCTISLPLGMITESAGQFSKPAPYDTIMGGFDQLCTDIDRCNSKTLLLLLNSSRVPADIFQALSELLSKQEERALSTTASIETSRTLGDAKAHDEKSSDKTKTSVDQQTLILFFTTVILPQLARHLSIETEQLEKLCHCYMQNFFSTAITLITPTLRHLTEQQNTHRKRDEKMQFIGIKSAATMSNITFATTGMEVTCYSKGIYVRGLLAKTESESGCDAPINLSLITPEPQLIVKLKARITDPLNLLPYKSFATDSMALARVFFERFCTYQLEQYQKFSDIDAKKTPSKEKLFTTPSKSPSGNPNAMLMRIYKNFLEKPPSDAQLIRMLNFFSTFAPEQDSIDNFLLDLNKNLELMITIDTFLTSLAPAERLDSAIDITSYPLEARENIILALHDLLEMQRRSPELNVVLEENRLTFINVSLSEVYKLVADNLFIYQLIDPINMSPLRKKYLTSPLEIQPDLSGTTKRSETRFSISSFFKSPSSLRSPTPPLSPSPPSETILPITPAPQT